MKDIIMNAKDFVKEHKHLINLLNTAGKEGKKQMEELKKMLRK